MRDNVINKSMRNTMLKIFVLRRIGSSKVNSYALLKEFSARTKLSSSFKSAASIKNEIYNTIRSLEKSSYIKSSQKIENGRLKNYYVLTAKGEETLKSAKKIFRKHLGELKILLNG